MPYFMPFLLCEGVKMNRAIIELQRDLLLDELMAVENQLKKEGIKRNKKGYSVFTRNDIYYVRYTDPQTGKQIHTQRSLGTTDKGEADLLAKKYRESFFKDYFDKKNGIKDLQKFFSEYYQLEKSQYLQELKKNNQLGIADPTIRHYNGFVNRYFIPFLQEKGITKIKNITLVVLRDFQNYLIGKGLKPKTINNNINGAIKSIFTNLLIKGVINNTPFIKETESARFNLKEKGTKQKRHSTEIYETLIVLASTDMWKLYKKIEDKKENKIANPKHWQKYRLLCLLMATTGLRDAEIFMLRKENIIQIRKTWFIDVVNSHIGNTGLKTESSKRKVPIPTITLQALNDYIADNNITDYLFYSGSKTIHYNMFGFAKNQFGVHCGYTEKKLKEKNIDFYSFRHFYNKMIYQSKIKDAVIQYFMGHAVNMSDMGERYNSIEDLDDLFFEENGLQVIEYIDQQFKKAINKYELLPVDYAFMEQVSLTDNKGKTKTFYTEVINKITFNDENHYRLDDLFDMGFISNTNNKNELLNELKTLFEDKTISKRQYDNFVYHIKNKVNFE